MLFQEFYNINMSVMTYEEFYYSRNKYKKTDEYVVKDELDKHCDIYWNSLVEVITHRRSKIEIKIKVFVTSIKTKI